MFGLDIALLVGGAVITESVFNLDGLGFMAIDSVFRRIFPGYSASCSSARSQS